MEEETGVSKSRIEALTDGIFAVVMTLLVFDISVPQISSHSVSVVAVGTELSNRRGLRHTNEDHFSSIIIICFNSNYSKS